MAFWRRVRQTFIGTRYFCWLELHRDGLPHYQALWLNPPSRKRVDLLYWVDRWWGGGRTQVRFKDQAWVQAKGTEYILGYAKKFGQKAYQQRYGDGLDGLRTFMCQRLEIDGPTLDEHLDRDVYRYVGPHFVEGQLVDEYLEFVERLQHVVGQGHWCTAVERRRSKRGRGVRRLDPVPVPAAESLGRELQAVWDRRVRRSPELWPEARHL